METYQSHYSLDVNETDYGKNITVSGWVEDIRNIGSIAFILDRLWKIVWVKLKCLKPAFFKIKIISVTV